MNMRRLDEEDQVTGMTMNILDPACGTRMMWFDKAHPGVVFGDCRSETLTVTDRTHREDGVCNELLGVT